MDEINCPCCGDEMNGALVVCWICFRASDRLMPGTYTTHDVLPSGDTWTITQADIDKWDKARDARDSRRSVNHG